MDHPRFDENEPAGGNVLPDQLTPREPSPTPVVQLITPEKVQASSPRFAGAWAALTYALCAMALGFPALLGKFLAGPNSDQFVAGYAFREFGASVLRATGSFPQWNPYLFGGMPFIAAMHGDIFYPTFLLRLVMPTDIAMSWSFILHLFLAGIFTYHFLRASGFGFYGALFGGVAYMLSGQLASLVSPGHDGKLYVSALFPLALLTLTHGIRDGRPWSWGLLALVIGLAVLSPHPQLLQYLLLASAAFTIHLAISAVRRGAMPRRTAVVRVAWALGAVTLGLAIGAIQYLPVREYVAWSPRAGGLASYATATSYAWPLKELFDAYLPQFTGMIDAYWGENAIHLHSDYVGVIVLMLAGAAFSRLGRDSRKGLVLFWTGALVIALLWAVGGDTPFYRIPYAIVPGTKYFRAPATVFFVGTMALAVLSAAGVERVLTRQVSYFYAIGWLTFAGIVVLLGSFGVLTDFAQALAPEEAVDSVIANSLNMITGAWRSFSFVLVAVIVILLHRRGKLPLAVAGWALVAAAAVDSWTIMRSYWIFSPPASVVYKRDAAIDRIRRESQPARVLAIELEPSGFRDTNLQGDGLMIHRVRTVLGYHGNQFARYNTLLQKDDGFRQIFNPNIWHLLNVRFLLTNSADVGALFPGAEWVIGPVKDAAGADTYLYRLPGDNPYAWIAPVIVKLDDDGASRTLQNPGFDVRRAALFPPEASVPEANPETLLPEPLALPVSVTSYAPGRVSLTLATAAPPGSALVVSENYYPGWRATVDGRPALTTRVDFTLIGVELPAGARQVELSFHSATYERGRLITSIALILAFALMAFGIAKERGKIG